MNYYSYKIEHDYGLAPNPFGGYCTIAVCKGDIRGSKRLELGDWIFGTGSKALEKIAGTEMINHLIYAMKVEEKITFDEYWNDSRFQYKKPIINGSLVKMYGDNFYHKDSETNGWVQENSAHSLSNGSCNIGHRRRDTKSENVLISKTFYYLGDNSPLIPDEFVEVCSRGRNVKGPAIPKDTADSFVKWLEENYSIGIYGDPINWKEHSDTIDNL
jgi:hypothetical protein